MGLATKGAEDAKGANAGIVFAHQVLSVAVFVLWV
jgi:hypothetical protein